MSNFARWEQESRQPLGPLQPDIPTPDPSHRFQHTVEVDMTAMLGEEPTAAAPEPSTAMHQIAEIQQLLAQERGAAGDVDADADADADWDDEDDDDRETRAAAARASLRETRERAGERLGDAGRTLATTGRSLGRWVASLDRRPEFTPHHGRDPLAQLDAGPRADRAVASPADHRRTVSPDAQAQYIAELEAEIAQLRAGQATPPEPPISITEEIERIGEETASILVVAHDKAHETARRAQEQADRRVRDADTRARAIVADAQRRLHQLDEETDAVWRERERLLEDVRTVCTALTALVDDAARRFPADPEPMAGTEIVPGTAVDPEASEVEAEATEIEVEAAAPAEG
jgi:hypothetical protein